MNTTWKRLGAACVLAAAASAATAQSWTYPSYNGGQQQNRGQGDRDQDRFNDYYAGQRQFNGAQERRGNELTPDERRTLRQQIDEAGRDIYKSRPRR